MSVYAKLNAARKEFHTLQLKKTGLNKFAGYSYFELGDFLIPALNVFEKHGLCALISFGTDVATMVITDVEDNSYTALTSPMAEAQLKGCHPIQNLGAVETYTRRYLWVAALEIVEHDALDSSPPIEKTVQKRGGLTGVGDDFPTEEKQWLQEAADYIKGLVANGKIDSAKDYLTQNNVEGDASLYLQRFLDTPTKKALGMVFVKAA